MSFMDKVKATAQTAVEKTKEGVDAGQEKVAEVKAKRHAQALLRDLGAAAYSENTAEFERVKAALDAHAAEHGPIDTAVQEP
jgi:hypothetical protein